MTAITPLEFIHKKGIFGDHHKKKEIDLLRISEVKNLSILQLVQYKKSTIDINNLKFDNLQIPKMSCDVISNTQTRILWGAPRTWLILSKNEKIINEVKKQCPETDFAVTEISHSRAVIKIQGLQAKEVLKKGSPLNFDEFKVNKCAGTIFHGISIVIDSISDKPHTFNILVLRSFAESFYHHITDSALEHGYVGI